MKTNSLMQLNKTINTQYFNENKVCETISIDGKTGNFKSCITINDSPIHLAKNDNTSSIVIYNNQLFFLSDKTGYKQLYHYDISNDTFKRITSFKYGVDELINVPGRLIIKTKSLKKDEKITKLLTKKERAELEFSLKHDAKVIDELTSFKAIGYSAFSDVYYSYTTKLSKLTNYKYETPAIVKQYPAINLEGKTKTIYVLNNQLEKEILEYFYEHGFNIKSITNLQEINASKSKSYLFCFEDGLLNNSAITNKVKKAVSFQSRTDKTISLGLTNEPINLSCDSLVDSWLKIAEESIIKNVDNINCDLLLVHPQFDYTHPLEEAELLYSALKDRKANLNVEMVVAQEENDFFFINGNMKKQICIYDYIIKWLKRGK